MDSRLESARRAVESGDWQLGRRLLADILRAEPNNGQAWLLLSRCVENPDQKKDCLLRAVALDPDNEDAKYELSALVAGGTTQARTSLSESVPVLTCLPARCPMCGAAIGPHDRKCSYCGTQFTVPAHVEVEQAPSEALEEVHPAVTQYSCPKCSITLLLAGGQHLSRCTNCWERVDPAHIHPVSLTETGMVVPFSRKRRDVEETLLRWMIEGDYTPHDILKSLDDAILVPVYLPYWVFTGTFEVSWATRVELDRFVDYPGPDGRVETVVETDSDPVQGRVRGRFEVAKLASLHHLPPAILAAVDTRHQIEGGLPLREAHLQTGVLEPCSLSADRVYKDKGADEIDRLIDAVVCAEVEQIPCDRYDHPSWRSIDPVECRDQKVFVPYWLVRYSYGGYLYTVLMEDGGERRIWGQRPEDKFIKHHANDIQQMGGWGCLAFLLMLILGVAATLVFQGRVGTVIAVVGAIGLLLSTVTYFWGRADKKSWIQKAARSRQRMLDRILESKEQLFKC